MDRIHKDDIVVVRTGKDKGKQGKVVRVYGDNGRALVEGINTVIKHRRRTQKEQQHEGRVKMERPIALSNLMLICKNCNVATRVGFSILKDKSKVRVCKKCNESF
jgi:large subunit ribosomal protein L24